MIARRKNQRVLPPCASGLFFPTSFAPRAVRAPGLGLAGGITCRRPGRPRGPPLSAIRSPSLDGDRLGPMT
jgi:hypothetical protein